MKPPSSPSPWTTVSRWVVAIILAQTLWFKFTGAPESKFIFTALGVEPWGRVVVGLVELVAVFFLVRHRTAVLGAMLAAGLMTGAIGTHLFTLGIAVQDDRGLLFGLAVIVLLGSVVILVSRRHQVARLLGVPYPSTLKTQATP
ncbi:MAG: DoxX family protein [Verrucomicrobiales bacterium]|nr:DoxX family protein [Verrucomicrobiales bacterium]